MTVSDPQDRTASAGSPPDAGSPARSDRPEEEPMPRSADDVMDELLGDDLDWERLVRSYPAPAVALAVAGGAWLGYRHGQAIFAAVTGYLASEAARRVNEFLGEDAL